MKKIFAQIISISIALIFLSSCNKEEDWNLNPAPSIKINSIEVSSTYHSYTITENFNTLLIEPGASVKINMTATGGNPIEQISFHDGTWGGNMTLVHGNDTIAATPPNSKYRLDANIKEVNFSMNFASISAKTVLSMFAIDENNMSGDFEYILEVKENFPTIKADSSMIMSINGTDTTKIFNNGVDSVLTTVNGKNPVKSAISPIGKLMVDKDAKVTFYVTATSTASNLLKEVRFNNIALADVNAIFGKDKVVVNTGTTTHNVTDKKLTSSTYSLTFDKVSEKTSFSMSTLDDHNISFESAEYTIDVKATAK